jgi:DNA-binding NtrC family response regulator
MDTVLVVDDDEEIGQRVAAEVRSLGLQGEHVATVEAALEHLRFSRTTRLVLVDLFLSGGDAAAFRRLKDGEGLLTSVPVALMVHTASFMNLADVVGVPILAKPVKAADIARMLGFAMARGPGRLAHSG